LRVRQLRHHVKTRFSSGNRIPGARQQ
jgi:hypothetical protein